MSTWKKIVQNVAPALATALGGPFAGIAVRELGKGLLGNEAAAEAEVAAAIESGGADAIVKLKQLDQDFAKEMARIGIDLEKLAVQDRADARARQVAMKDWVPSALAIAVVIAFFVLLFLMLNYTIPEPNRDAVNLLLGMLAGSLTSVMTYYFGSSAGSRAKDEVLGRVAGTKK